MGFTIRLKSAEIKNEQNLFEYYTPIIMLFNKIKLLYKLHMN